MKALLTRPLARVLRAGHPWIYRDALTLEGGPFDAPAGTVVEVHDRQEGFVGRGLAESGPIGLRLWTIRDEPFGAELVRRRMMRADELRRSVVPAETSAYRLANGEGDRMPGVSIDVYEDIESKLRWGVLRLDGEGAAAHVELLAAELARVLRPEDGILLRRSRRHRGDGPKVELLRASAGGEDAPPERIVIEEHGMRLVADLREGQKTGLFLDHRESRKLVRELSGGATGSIGKRVLNLYSYTGGFSVAAGLGGASQVTSVDVAPEAIRLADESWRENDLPDVHEATVADVPRFLEDDPRVWDLVVSDPPSFAPNEDAVPSALDAYATLHTRCLQRTLPGGLYLAGSCSSHVDMAMFDETIREGAQRSGRVVQVLGRWGAPPDHARLASFPEGDYLKVVLLRSLD